MLDETSFSELKRLVQDKFHWNTVHVSPLAVEGSDRLFYRIRNNGRSMILMMYGDEKAENDYYVHIQQFLKELHVNVPQIVCSIPEKKWILLEDLGDISLHNIMSDLSMEDKKRIYESVLDNAALIHHDGYELYRKNSFVTAPHFDKELYCWEHRYFLDNYLIRYKNYSGKQTELETELNGLAHQLSLEKNKLIHRDLQSKNILIKDNIPYLIDFQGLRSGLPAYDIASLLYDPYVNLDDTLIEDLFKYYLETYVSQNQHQKERQLFELCSIQRLLQAMGAYGYLGLVKGKEQFLTYMKPAENILRKQVYKCSLLPELARIMKSE